MKTILFFKLLIISFLGILFVCCNTDTDNYQAGGDLEINEVLPEGKYDIEVKNLSTTSALHKVILKWEEPDNHKDLNHYQIEWKGSVSDKALYSKAVKKGISQIEIDRLFNEDYTFTVKCVSEALLYSDGVQISGKTIPDYSIPEAIRNLEVEALAISADISWENPDTEFEKINLFMFDVTNNEPVDTAILSKKNNFYQISGLKEANEYRVKVYLENYLGTKSATVEKNVKTGIAGYIVEGEAKANSIEDAKINKSDLQVYVLKGTCSSPGQDEGADEFRRTFDGIITTMYHSQWSLGGSGNPSHKPSFIYEFEEPTQIDYIAYQGRISGSNGRVQAMSVSVMTAKSDPKYIMLGTFDPVINSANVKRIFLPVTTGILKVKFDVLKSANNDLAVHETMFFRYKND